VHTIDQARRLYEMGVDGFTSDNLEMLRCIVEHGPMALDIAAPA
jgi:glycerophosphoryl diester phosphodiesterase